MSWLYLAGLVFALSCLVLVDWRNKLALFVERRRTLIVIALSVLIFVVWDILGIILGIFFHGGSVYTAGIWLGPEFPLEEIFFLTLLTYSALLSYQLWSRR